MWGLGREPGPPQPGQASPTPRRVPASLPLVSTLPDAKGYLLQLVPIHYEGPLNQQGHFWGVSRGRPLGAGAQPRAPKLVLLGAGGARETLGCVGLKVSAGNKKIGVNYYSSSWLSQGKWKQQPEARFPI